MKKFEDIKKRIIVAIISLVAFFNLSAQVDTQLSQYWAMPAYYNPAATGLTDFLHITAGSRLQWVGMPNAPTSFLATADMPVKVLGKRVGVGVALQQESLGLFSNFPD